MDLADAAELCGKLAGKGTDDFEEGDLGGFCGKIEHKSKHTCTLVDVLRLGFIN